MNVVDVKMIRKLNPGYKSNRYEVNIVGIIGCKPK